MTRHDIAARKPTLTLRAAVSSLTARDDVGSDELTVRLRSVAQKTRQLANVSLCLTPTKNERRKMEGQWTSLSLAADLAA